MKFNVKDVKSWANRHDIKVGDIGYFADNIGDLKFANKGQILSIDDNCGVPFLYTNGDTKNETRFCFFLPLEAVKEDKPKEKKYRPIKNMRELTDVVRGKDWTTAISTDEELLVRCKYNKHRIKVLITRLEFDNNLELVSINNKAPKILLENYEVMSVNGNFMPFGVEVEDEY